MTQDERELRLFGERVREARTALSISQEDLAFRCGLDRTYISGIERGKRNISLLKLVTIAKALEVDPSQLVDGIR
ncbi:helix-turn-helix domain-containing protein [Gammaproteobacteria bacterium]|nr:helix-turn-helix domain-containing protein [Gammaproteobacteria bacterium]